MTAPTLLAIGIIGLIASLHLIRTSGAALGVPPRLTAAAVRLVV